ncbi:asparaginase, partial [Saccharomonospora azurea]|uniref:asparaginase n=1 Tax=Saccharomonospora azurea TaxID=40988 RepID=UPI001146EED5
PLGPLDGQLRHRGVVRRRTVEGGGDDLGGAEGVHAMTLPDGTTVAVKVDDGASRARGPILVAALRALGALPDNPAARAVVDGLGRGAGLVLGGGREVGELRVPATVEAELARRLA